MNVYTFTTQATSDEVQSAIDSNDGLLTITIPWMNTRGYEDVCPGDGAVIEVSDPNDKSSWIGDIQDGEYEEGYPLTVTIDIR